MALQQNDKIYTAEDFERYHSGKMSEAEMHALEKAALIDPFIADALEGYANASNPVKDVTELREKLFQKEKKKTVFFLHPKQKLWLKIAAVFVLVFGIGSIFYFQNSKKDYKLLSKNEKIKSGPNDSPAFKNEVTYDSVTNLSKTNSLPDSTNQTSANAYVFTQKPKLKIFQNDSDKDQRDILLLKKVPEKDLGFSTSSALKDEDRQNKTDSIIFRMPADSTANVASSSGYKSKRELNKSTQPVVFENDKKTLNEVVVTAQGIGRKEKQTGFFEKQLPAKAAGVLLARDSAAQPTDGLQKFDEYVLNNIKIPVNEKGEKYKGNVVLSFTVNKKGAPAKIKVEQSLCAACDDEAIRLLKHGPKWKTNSNRNNVIIKF